MSTTAAPVLDRSTPVSPAVPCDAAGEPSDGIPEPLERIADAELSSPSGGVSMRLTQYGYPHDPYSDSETRKGHGAYHSLVPGESVALTDSGLRALGLSRSEVRSAPHWVDIKLRGGGTLERRIDDRAPEANRRADLYQPGGFDRGLPDYADVTLRR